MRDGEDGGKKVLSKAARTCKTIKLAGLLPGITPLEIASNIQSPYRDTRKLMASTADVKIPAKLMSSTADVKTPAKLMTSTADVDIPAELVIDKADETIPATKMSLKADATIPATKVSLKADETIPATKMSLKADETIPATKMSLKADETIPATKMSNERADEGDSPSFETTSGNPPQQQQLTIRTTSFSRLPIGSPPPSGNLLQQQRDQCQKALEAMNN